MAAPRTSQFNEGLSSAEAMAACGPTAAIAFAQTYGRNPTVGEAMQLARSVGWNPSSGMAGPQSEVNLLGQLGVAANYTPGADWNAIATEANTGNPVIISTPGHYYYADGYNPANDTFHVGTSGTDLKGGAEWMSANQMQALMGQVQGTIYADHPLQGPSSQVSGTITPSQNPPSNNNSFLSGWYGGGASTPVQAQQAPVTSNSIPAEFAGKPYAQEAYQAAINAGIDPNVFLRQINQESGFNPNAGSKAGAQGIAQIVPQYHPGVNTADPIASLNYAANLDKQLLQQYGGDYTKALVAYNGGGGAVNAWTSGQPYGESQTYINNILGGQNPAPFNAAQATQAASQNMGIQPQQQPQQPRGILGQLLSMGNVWANPSSMGNQGPSMLTQALSNSYTPNLNPPMAQPNPMNLFSSIFTRPG